MTTETAILRRAREIISDPERWTKRTYARNSAGKSVEPGDTDACRWCALGAVVRACADLGVSDGEGAAAVDYLYEMAELSITVVEINDHDGHAAVLALFDKALAQEAAQ